MKIIGIYKITNTVTGDFYIGSSKDVKQRWRAHKCKSTWKNYPNIPMYLDMQRYGIDKFEFQILEEVEEGSLKEKEQYFIETLKPTYNNYNAKGLDTERQKKTKKECDKEYRKSEKYKEYQKEYQKEYKKSDKYKESQKKYQKSDKGKEAQKKYQNQLCFYNNETLTLNALRMRFKSQGIDHPTLEAKKYLIKN